MIIITATLSLASATRHACDEDAARALKRPWAAHWAPVVFHGERETESLPEIDARFTPDGDADEAAGFRAVDDFNELEPIPALSKAYVPGSPHRASALARRAATLPRVARFPSTSELMRALRRGGSLWIENAGAADGPSRVKILGVVSADCP